MTLVSFTENDGHITVSAHDHATGSEMVCNGISVLLFTLEGWLRNRETVLKNHVSIMESGHATIEFTPLDYDVYKILGFVYLGMKQIEKTYKDFIRVRIDETLEKRLG